MSPHPCPTCRAQVLEGRDDTGVDVTLDASPLDPMGELGAVLDDRRTWTLHGNGELYGRTPFAMRHRPAGTRARQTVHPAHRCPAGSGT